MRNTTAWAIGVAVVLAIGGALYWMNRQPAEEPLPPLLPETPVAPAEPEPAVKHPVPGEADGASLPTLDESDEAFRSTLSQLFGAQALQDFLVPQNLIRRVVVTIDNLPNRKVAARLVPVKPVPGQLEVSGTEEARTLSPANYARYKPIIRLVESTDAGHLTAVYFRFYPLFQEAYRSLGHPPEYFNDRLVEVIDHLLETPDIGGEIRLTQPSVFYEFADPALEARSAGQKALIRMGSENAAIVKATLREIRQIVTTQGKME